MPDMNPYCITKQTSGTRLGGLMFHVVAGRGGGLVDVASHALATMQLGPMGVLFNSPAPSRAATVAVFGQAKVKVGAAVGIDKQLTCNGSGRAIEAVSGAIVFGTAMSAASTDGEIIDVFLYPAMRCGSV